MTYILDDTRKAEIVVHAIFNHMERDTLPSKELKAEFHRLRKAGFIEYIPEQQILRVIYKNK